MIVADAEREHWKRKPAPAMDPAKDAIVFQQLDIDYVISEPHAMLGPKRKAMGPAAMLRIFGVTAGGNSVCVHVRGRAVLLRQGARLVRRRHVRGLPQEPERGGVAAAAGRRPEPQRRVHQRRGGCAREAVADVLPGGKDEHVCQDHVYAAEPSRDGARGILEKQGLHVPGLHHAALCFQTFESNVLYTLRFMVDRGVVGGNWVELPAGGYAHREKKQSMCQYECDVRYDAVVSHAPEGQYSKLAPFRILSVDIECAGRKGHFPDAEHDPVIQIATMVTCQGDDKPAIRAI